MRTTNLNIVETFFCRLLGLHPQALSYCSPQTKKAYINMGFALIFVSFLAIATGIELGVNFTDNTYLIVGTGILVSVLVFAMDYFILSISNVNAIGVVSRLVISFTITIMSVVSLLLLINGRDIENHLTDTDNTAITNLDEAYNQQKENRYNNLEKLIDARNRYYHEVVMPEALDGFADKKYDRKKVKYDADGIMIDRERAKLDSIESTFHTQYAEQRTKLVDKNKPGIFEKVELLIKILKASTTKILFAIIIFIILLGLEISALLAKFSLSKNNDYIDEWLPKVIASEKLANERDLNTNERTKTSSIENEHLTLQRQENTRALIQFQEDFLFESTKLNMLKALSIKHGNNESAKMAEQGLKTLIDLYTTENLQVNPTVNVSVDINDIFRVTEPMKSIVETIMGEYGENKLAIAEAIFTWIHINVKYDYQHTKEYYKTATETYNFRSGICGEQSVLYISFLRFANIDAQYVHVSKDDKGEVNHACVQISIDNEKFLSDTAYHQFKIEHVEYEVLTDDQLADNYKFWNK